MKDQVDTSLPLTHYPILAPTPYQLGFRFQVQRDLFNKGLAVIRRSGEYLAVEQRYSEY